MELLKIHFFYGYPNDIRFLLTALVVVSILYGLTSLILKELNKPTIVGKTFVNFIIVGFIWFLAGFIIQPSFNFFMMGLLICLIISFLYTKQKTNPWRT
jgi:hypothetical protein